MNRRFLIGTFSIALSFVPTAGYPACRELSLAEAFQGADAVIEAEILAGQPHSIRGWKTVQLRQRKVWKKSKVPMDTILDFAASPERPPLVVGDTYLLFLERPVDGKLTIGKCSPRTHRLPVTNDEVVELQRLTFLVSNLSPSMGPQTTASQWKSVVYAHRAGGTGAASLRARTSDLIHLSVPRQVAVRTVFRYDPATDKWVRLVLGPLPSMTLPVPSPRQIYSAESDQVLLTIPAPVGLFWAVWEEDAHRIASAVYAGPRLCEDVMLGPAPSGRIAMCVPFADRAEARFVPDPAKL